MSFAKSSAAAGGAGRIASKGTHASSAAAAAASPAAAAAAAAVGDGAGGRAYAGRSSEASKVRRAFEPCFWLTETSRTTAAYQLPSYCAVSPPP